MNKIWRKLTNPPLKDSSKTAARVSFNELTKEQKKQVIQEGAKKFSKDFTDTIVKLANE